MRLRRRGDEHVGLLSHDTSCGELAAQLTNTAGDLLRNRQNFMALKESLHPLPHPRVGPPRQAEEDLFHADDGNGKPSDTTCPDQHALIRVAPAELADDIGVNEIAQILLPPASR